MFRQLAVLIALGILAGPLGAQQVALQRGSEVRVYTRVAYVAGRLLDLSPSAIVVAEMRSRTDTTRVIETLERSAVLLLQFKDGREWTDVPPSSLPDTCPTPTGPVLANGEMIAPGARLRVRTPRGRIEGTLVEWKGESITLAGANGNLSTARIGPDTRIAALAGGHRGAITGLVTGVAFGVLVGAVAGGAACGIGPVWGDGASSDRGCPAAGEGALMGGMVLGVLGTTVGALASGNRWVEIPSEELRLFVANTRS